MGPRMTQTNPRSIPAPGVQAGDAQPRERRAALLVLALLVAVFATNVLSAYLRHREAGLGCTPWPSCYGVIDAEARDANRPQPVVAALNPDLLIKQAHRTVAGVLVVLVLLVLNECRRMPRLTAFERNLPYAIAAVTLLLAVVGPASYLKTRPAIATANMVGGLVMLAVTWRLLLGLWQVDRLADPRIRRLATIALTAVGVQVGLGAWTSANFAGAACTGLTDCGMPAGVAPGPGAFWYLRELSVDAAGRIETDANAWLVHVAHRAGAVIAAVATAFLLLATRRERTLTSATWLLAAALATQVALGIAGVSSELPLAVVLLHNAGAAALVLILVWVRYRVQPS
jgi:cytochrome c oxidase assembly protein subunit 15